ncbi:MAG: glycosyltransferase family 4 protein [Steroidobacteraceae bacterium]|jgi:glycosyltransferase involved in cell wall biosynthesis
MGRVLVSAHTYQPEGVSEGFTAAQLVAAMRQRGYRVTVLTAALPSLKYGFGVLGVHCSTNTEVAYFSPANYLEYSARSLLMMRRLRKRFALVHHVSPIVMRVPSFFGALGRPFIWGPVGGSVPYPPGFEGYGQRYSLVNALRLLDRPRLSLDPTLGMTMRSADRIVVTTSMGAELIPDAHRAKTVVIPEGIPESLVLAAPPMEEPYIFSSGRLIEYKATDLLIRAFARVRDSGVKLVITGDGPKKAELAALIATLRLGDRVRLLGRVSREENHRLMSQSLFCVFPALREAFGHVNLEAMAAWKPVVATDWGGPKDLIVDGVTGFKVLGRNPQQHIDMLVSAIERLIGDPELRRRMGIAAVARVRDEFVWRRLADRYERLYRALA